MDSYDDPWFFWRDLTPPADCTDPIDEWLWNNCMAMRCMYNGSPDSGGRAIHIGLSRRYRARFLEEG